MFVLSSHYSTLLYKSGEGFFFWTWLIRKQHQLTAMKFQLMFLVLFACTYLSLAEDEPVSTKTHCERHRDSIPSKSSRGHPIIGAFVPKCGTDGAYSRQQCHGSTGHCWCVDDQGRERVGTRTAPGTPPKDCDNPVERPKTHCERHRDSIPTSTPEGHPILGAFIPQCDAEGTYTHQQCHGSTGHCWCVDSMGQEKAGTRTSPGTPPKDCDSKTHCQHQRDNTRVMPGSYVPQCEDNGEYRALQCHGSTGHCWCVNSLGKELLGTRTGPGSARTGCQIVEPAPPKTLCEHHRDTTPVMPGSFVPQCDAKGEYASQQCHGSTGHCWCVNSLGKEIVGTRTPASAPQKDCKKPDEPERAKTHCERHRDSIPNLTSEGHLVLGAFVPECGADGTYTPKQCHGSTGHCWCVDSLGKERVGTRTPPGTALDCDSAVERNETHCEHHRDSIPSLTSEGHPVLGAFIPECDANGSYKPKQCHGSTGHCWCVDSMGQEKAGTRTSPGTPPKDCGNLADQ